MKLTFWERVRLNLSIKQRCAKNPVYFWRLQHAIDRTRHAEKITHIKGRDLHAAPPDAPADPGPGQPEAVRPETTAL